MEPTINEQRKADLLAINDKFDAKINDAEVKLQTLRTNKAKQVEKVKDYYDAVEAKEKAEAIISKGKPVV